MIEILKESKDDLLVVKATEKLTSKDYEETFIPALEEILKHHEKLRILFYLPEEFKGWELGAMWDDATFGMKHRKDFKKMALVGGPKWVAWGVKIAGYLISGEIETYDVDDFVSALAWLEN